MPLDQVRAVLHAPDARPAATRRSSPTSSACRSSSSGPRRRSRRCRRCSKTRQRTAERRLVDRSRPTSTLAITDDGRASTTCGDWLRARRSTSSTDELAALGARRPPGADGALYCSEFFEVGLGEVTAFVPIAGDPVRSAVPARARDPAGADVAVLVHEGPFADLDRTYGALGTHRRASAASASTDRSASTTSSPAPTSTPPITAPKSAGRSPFNDNQQRSNPR